MIKIYYWKKILRQKFGFGKYGEYHVKTIRNIWNIKWKFSIKIMLLLTRESEKYYKPDSKLHLQLNLIF